MHPPDPTLPVSAQDARTLTRTPLARLPMVPRTVLSLGVLLFVLAACTSGDFPTGQDGALTGIDPVSADGSCVIENRTFDDDVALKARTHCTFVDVRIEGNLRLNRGARLLGTRIEVDGNIQAQRATSLSVLDSEIHGDIQFEQGGDVEVQNTRVDGNLQLGENEGSLFVESSVIEGDLQAFQNRLGPFQFEGNTIDGNLQCKENSPSPRGSGNMVNGNREDQCIEL